MANGDDNKKKSILINSETGEKLESPVYETTQLLKKLKNSDGTVTESYATSYFTVLSYDGSFYDSGWDSTLGTKAYGTIYWDNSSNNGEPTRKIMKVTGGWIPESGVTVINKKVKFGQYGWHTGDYTVTNSSTKYPTSLTYSYTSPSSWGYLYVNAVGAFSNNLFCDLQRGTTTWSFIFMVTYEWN